MSAHDPNDLQRIYDARFATNLAYRDRVWGILVQEFFQQFVQSNDRVLDLGAGYGEFIRHIACAEKFAMDLNPDTKRRVGANVTLFEQDCSMRWPLAESALDVVFTSNFFEHLPDKAALGRTLDEVMRCLAPGGRLIAMGPNIKFLPGSYWDFWDHYVPLTELSLAEALETRGFKMNRVEDRFLPYTMANGPTYPPAFLRAYLRIRPAWKIFGRQFLVVASKVK
jgi:SAM-dependent methyltransferase